MAVMSEAARFSVRIVAWLGVSTVLVFPHGRLMKICTLCCVVGAAYYTKRVTWLVSLVEWVGPPVKPNGSRGKEHGGERHLEI